MVVGMDPRFDSADPRIPTSLPLPIAITIGWCNFYHHYHHHINNRSHGTCLVHPIHGTMSPSHDAAVGIHPPIYHSTLDIVSTTTATTNTTQHIWWYGSNGPHDIIVALYGTPTTTDTGSRIISIAMCDGQIHLYTRVQWRFGFVAATLYDRNIIITQVDSVADQYCDESWYRVDRTIIGHHHRNYNYLV